MKSCSVLLKSLGVFVFIFSVHNAAAQHNHHVPKEENEKYTVHVVTVTGAVQHPISFTRDSLIKWGLKHSTYTNTEGDKTTTGSYDAYPLADILDKAGIIQKDKKDKAFYIVVRGSDGYTAVLSWADVFDTMMGNIGVVVKENDELITEKGDMKLTNTLSAHSSQHIYFLKSIEVHHVE